MSEKNESNLFRKKPVVVQAVQYPCNHPALRRCDCDGNSACSSCGLEYIETLEGCMNVSPGDWIITGVQGEHYPCKPDIFAATYEPANAPASSAPGDAQDERQAFVTWLTGSYPHAYSEPEAVRLWHHGHVSALAWQKRARISAPAAGDALEGAVVGSITVKGRGHSSVSLDASHADLPEGEYVIRAALAAQVPHKGEAA
ncbi:hypothetical protein [Achromobacter mucicolens]|uniref:hypothetical protein n=1 Tax=Achromobacter mucicolens TaxID=1389922 RepID=UPI001CBA9842|nr:hypothetical protein [Achromobacter mucicolens]UAN04415.1 hypothetical protein K9D24_09875 [Achromobacter mucicolens]